MIHLRRIASRALSCGSFAVFFSEGGDMNAALNLVSDEVEFIAGVAMEVDGGRCI
jgi:hypothetical protein